MGLSVFYKNVGIVDVGMVDIGVIEVDVVVNIVVIVVDGIVVVEFVVVEFVVIVEEILELGGMQVVIFILLDDDDDFDVEEEYFKRFEYVLEVVSMLQFCRELMDFLFFFVKKWLYMKD